MNFYYLPPSAVYGLFITLVMSLAVITVFLNIGSSGKRILAEGENRMLKPLSCLLCLFLIILLGNRMPNAHGIYGYGDTAYYAHFYNRFAVDFVGFEEKEWLWHNLQYFCHEIGLATNEFFMVVELIYLGLMLATCFMLTRRNVWLAFLFFVCSFSFYGYAVNGIRNGLASSIALLAIAMFTDKRYWCKVVSLCVIFLAASVHSSLALIGFCMLAAVFIKSPQVAIRFWVFSIILSLVLGGPISSFFASFGFDDDRAIYFNEADAMEDVYRSQFSATGFRWDFLLYSAMPVLMVWITTVKRKFNDSAYNTIAITYLLANAFWIMVIRSSFSNRFAYLSWFMYPIVIAYPLLRFNIWDDQDRRTAIILLAYAGFTFLRAT